MTAREIYDLVLRGGGNDFQATKLEIALETHRRLYNAALAQRRWFYDEWQISRSYSDQSGLV